MREARRWLRAVIAGEQDCGRKDALQPEIETSKRVQIERFLECRKMLALPYTFLKKVDLVVFHDA